MNQSDERRKQAKRLAVVARLREANDALDIVSSLWDEKTLDALLLAFGIGRVEIND